MSYKQIETMFIDFLEGLETKYPEIITELKKYRFDDDSIISELLESDGYSNTTFGWLNEQNITKILDLLVGEGDLNYSYPCGIKCYSVEDIDFLEDFADDESIREKQIELGTMIELETTGNLYASTDKTIKNERSMVVILLADVEVAGSKVKYHLLQDLKYKQFLMKVKDFKLNYTGSL